MRNQLHPGNLSGAATEPGLDGGSSPFGIAALAPLASPADRLETYDPVQPGNGAALPTVAAFDGQVVCDREATLGNNHHAARCRVCRPAPELREHSVKLIQHQKELQAELDGLIASMRKTLATGTAEPRCAHSKILD